MPSDFSKDPDPYLDLAEENPEDLGEEVQKTNTELEKLQRQLEDIEKQKVRLEELKRRQDELDNGRGDMMDKLTRSAGDGAARGRRNAKAARAIARHPQFFYPAPALHRIDQSRRPGARRNCRRN